MKYLSFFLIGTICALSIGCGNSKTVNGRSMKTAYRSVKTIKEYLPGEQRMEFEVAFWTLNDIHKNNKDAFLDAVDGKSVPELISTAKEAFAKQKSSGLDTYDQYTSWEDMIAKLAEERKMNSAGNLKDKPAEKRERANNVLYDLH